MLPTGCVEHRGALKGVSRGWGRSIRQAILVVALVETSCDHRRSPRPAAHRRVGACGEVHGEQQVLRHRLPRDVAVPRHLGEVDAQAGRLREVPHRARTGQLPEDQDGRLARGVGALHGSVQEADHGHAAHSQLRLRTFRLSHQRADEQDDLARPAGAGQVPARQRRPHQAALHLLPCIARARRRARGHRPAGQIDAVVLHLPHRRHQELQLLPQASARRPRSLPGLPRHQRLDRRQGRRSASRRPADRQARADHVSDVPHARARR